MGGKYSRGSHPPTQSDSTKIGQEWGRFHICWLPTSGADPGFCRRGTHLQRTKVADVAKLSYLSKAGYVAGASKPLKTEGDCFQND